jgi:hypothetical protein
MTGSPPASSSPPRSNNAETALKLLSPLLAIAAFAWGIYTYRDTARQQLDRQKAEAERTAQTRRIEATRPFLDKQLTLYTEATKVAASLATTTDEKERAKLKKRFMELFWGDLGLVEREGVALAMVEFRRGLDRNAGPAELGTLALALAHACREELAVSWGTDAWKR